MKAVVGLELAKAQLCQPCSLIVESSTRCPFCKGIALLPVSQYLPVVREGARLLSSPEVLIAQA